MIAGVPTKRLEFTTILTVIAVLGVTNETNQSSVGYRLHTITAMDARTGLIFLIRR